MTMVPSCRIIILTVSILVGSTAYAQQVGIGGSYEPPKPTMSPWLQLNNRNAGGVDNYHAFVRPQLQLQATLQQQGMKLKGLAGNVNQMMDNDQQLSPTGSGSVFMEYSHYYDRDLMSGRQATTSRRLPGR